MFVRPIFLLPSPLLLLSPPAGYCGCVQIRLVGCIFSGLCIKTVSLAVYIIRERLWRGRCQRPWPTDISCVLVCELATVVVQRPLHNLSVIVSVCERVHVCVRVKDHRWCLKSSRARNLGSQECFLKMLKNELQIDEIWHHLKPH